MRRTPQRVVNICPDLQQKFLILAGDQQFIHFIQFCAEWHPARLHRLPIHFIEIGSFSGRQLEFLEFVCEGTIRDPWGSTG